MQRVDVVINAMIMRCRQMVYNAPTTVLFRDYPQARATQQRGGRCGVGTGYAARQAFFGEGLINNVWVGVCRGKVRCNVEVLWASITNIATNREITQELTYKVFVRVGGKFALEDERSYWGDQLVVFKGRAAPGSPT